MKIRIGYGLGTRTNIQSGDELTEFVGAADRLGFDSLWFSERLGANAPDPTVAMAWTCARTTRLKVGMSVMVLPGRNPVVLAKTIASLDRLSGGRVLPAFGLGAANAAEHQAFGVDRKDRGRWFNEALPLMRRLWTEDHVTHHGPRFDIEDVTIAPRPIQDPLEVWLGGIAPLELKRVGRLGDGWLPSFCTAAQVAAGREEIERVAASHDRVIDPEHFGALIPYRATTEPLSEPYQALLAARNPDADPDEIIPTTAALPAAIGRFIDVGFSKFVLVPVVEPADWTAELGSVAELVRPLEN